MAYTADYVKELLALTDRVRPGDTVWSRLGAYPWPSAAVPLTVQSTNPNDTAGGTGARAVEVRGVQDSGAFYKTLVPLNGQQGVPVPVDLLRCPLTYVTEVGTAGANLGTITVTTSTGTTLAEILPKEWRSYAALTSTPNGWSTQIAAWAASLRENRNSYVEFVVRWRGDFGLGDDPWVTADFGALNRFSPLVSFRGLDDAVPPRSDIEWVVKTAQGNNRGVALAARWEWSAV